MNISFSANVLKARLFCKLAANGLEISSQLQAQKYKRFSQNRLLEESFTSLADLWFATNLEVNNSDFIPPARFRETAEQWNNSSLPFSLRKYRSGMLALQSDDQALEATGPTLLSWLEKTQCEPQQDAEHKWYRASGGVTVVETAKRFGWNLSFALEELESFEEKGDLCRDTNEGEIRFWRNKLFVPNLLF